jgi:transcriptional regulator with XRE-family HTH domain
MVDTKSVAQRIREVREQLGMTQGDLAKAIGCTRPGIALWETGRRQVSIVALRKIARAFDMPLAKLLGEHGKGNVFRITDPRERTLIELYRHLSPLARAKLLEISSAFATVDERHHGDRDKRLMVPQVGQIDRAA